MGEFGFEGLFVEAECVKVDVGGGICDGGV